MITICDDDFADPRFPTNLVVRGIIQTIDAALPTGERAFMVVPWEMEASSPLPAAEWAKAMGRCGWMHDEEAMAVTLICLIDADHLPGTWHGYVDAIGRQAQ